MKERADSTGHQLPQESGWADSTLLAQLLELKAERTAICKELGVIPGGPALIIVAARVRQQAVGWGLLNDVLDGAASIPVAANRLRKEVEACRRC